MQDYVVQAGDTLSGIGKAFKVPYPLLANINGIEGSVIGAGSTLRVVQGPFHILVLRGTRKLRLYCRGTWVREYTVAVGKTGNETVLGEFLVRTKMQNPAWTNPDTKEVVPFGDKGNPLGTRWIGVTDGIGIHGTWEPESLGKAASRGCIRMRNADVEEVFALVVRGASVVKIVKGPGPGAGGGKRGKNPPNAVEKGTETDDEKRGEVND
jgi:LysM repeat protein